MLKTVQFHLVLIISLTFFSISCKDKANNGNSQNITYSTPNNAPKWSLQTIEDTLGNPQTKIFLVLKDTIKIADATAPFKVLEAMEYAEKKLPANTVTACSGFWAGLDNLFIVVDSADTWVVKARYEDEGMEAPAVFENLKVIKK